MLLNKQHARDHKHDQTKRLSENIIIVTFNAKERIVVIILIVKRTKLAVFLSGLLLVVIQALVLSRACTTSGTIYTRKSCKLH